MNLVIDDAVEVRLATNTEEEKRRPLGMDCDPWIELNELSSLLTLIYRPNPPQGRQRLPHSNPPISSLFSHSAVKILPITYHERINPPVMRHYRNLIDHLLLERQGH